MLSSFCWQTFFSSISRDLATLGRNKKVKAKKSKDYNKINVPRVLPFGYKEMHLKVESAGAIS